MNIFDRFFCWLFSEEIAEIEQHEARLRWNDHRKQCRPQARTRSLLFGAAWRNP